VLPVASAPEARLIAGVEIVPVDTLGGAVDELRRDAGRRRRRTTAPPRIELGTEPLPTALDPSDQASDEPGAVPDLADVRGQLEGRRALEIALAGGHGMLMLGPPGSGKTLLARTIPGLLPPLDDAEALEASIIESVAGHGPLRRLVRRRAFRAPHHTLSYAAMVGGGPRLRPGEVTRANGGVLFLDELPEFGRDVLEALREPLEEGRVVVARAGGVATFPARFQLVAAMNPCPCGGADPPGCSCPIGVAERYRARVSGPLRDRIDLWVSLPRVPAVELLDRPTPEPTAVVAARIAAIRALQDQRQSTLNARLRGAELRRVCRLDALTSHRAIQIAELEAASARGTERLLRVARTIADLAEAEWVAVEHLEEAARYRTVASRAMRAMAS
jgi:magnesium chelatase family protein